MTTPSPTGDQSSPQEASQAVKRVVVWADPEVPGPPLYRRDIVDGFHCNLSYGWTWWSARQVVALPAGMTFLDALASDGPVEVTVVGDVSPLATGLNEVHQRVSAEWSTNRPEPRLLDPGLLCEEVGKGYARSGGDLDDAIDIGDDLSGHWGDYFRKARDIERRERDLPRAVVRSDDYGRQPHHLLVHDWPDGTFTQGGKISRGEEPGVFIETFPRDPATYLRGEGATYAEAEAAAWARWEQITACPTRAATGVHDFATRGYRNGAGFCRSCDLFQSHVFDLTEIGSVCVVCAEPYYATVPHRTPDGEWLRRRGADGNDHCDMVCQTHNQPGGADRWDYLRDIEAHLCTPGDPATPLPDIAWMSHRLPANFPHGPNRERSIDWAGLSDAYQHAHRDWLDGLIAEKD